MPRYFTASWPTDDGPVALLQLNAGRLWAGGVASAVVAAPVVIAGVGEHPGHRGARP